MLLEIGNPLGPSPAAVLGGTVPWNDGVGGGLNPEMQALLDALPGNFDANAIVGLLLDLGPHDACDSLSLGMSVTLSPPI